MAATGFRQIAQSGLMNFTPAQLWEYHSRVKRSATVEVAAVPVERYAAKVPDPGNKTLEAFFDKYRDQYPDPNSPEPGFRVPKRITVQYFEANLEKLTDPKAVTAEEIEEEYQKEKER